MSDAASPTTISIARGTWLDPRTAEPVGHPQLMRQLSLQQVVLLGETHDRYDVHRWQLHVATGIMGHRSDIALGFEMFPRRLQPVLDASSPALSPPLPISSKRPSGARSGATMPRSTCRCSTSAASSACQCWR